MLRCALLLSFSTMRSVDGQPGAWPSRLGETIGSPGAVISTAKQMWSVIVGPRCHSYPWVGVLTRSPAPNETARSGSVPASWYTLPVPKGDTRKCAVTVAALPPAFLRIRAKPKFRPD